MIKELLFVILLTLTPFLELRASIPYALLTAKLNIYLALSIIIITNIILGPVVLTLLNFFAEELRKIKFFNILFEKTIERVRRKSKKYVEKYGFLGLALFIAVPLPGSGSYSGSLAAFIFDVKLKKFIIANTIGNIIAAIAVTLLTITGKLII